jgi:hypothetical protein
MVSRSLRPITIIEHFSPFYLIERRDIDFEVSPAMATSYYQPCGDQIVRYHATELVPPNEVNDPNQLRRINKS